MATTHGTQRKENAGIRCQENKVPESHCGPFRRKNSQAQENMLRIVWWQTFSKYLTKRANCRIWVHFSFILAPGAQNKKKEFLQKWKPKKNILIPSFANEFAPQEILSGNHPPWINLQMHYWLSDASGSIFLGAFFAWIGFALVSYLNWGQYWNRKMPSARAPVVTVTESEWQELLKKSECAKKGEKGPKER